MRNENRREILRASDVARLIESIAPLSSGMAGDELGFIYGGPETQVNGVAVCWSPTMDVILEAERLGCNMIISHEPLFFKKSWSVDAEAKNVWFEEAEDAKKLPNCRRAEALARMNGCVWRAHSNWDAAPGLGIVDSLVARLELGPVAKRGRFTTLHELPPISVRELARRVQERLRTGAIRIVGELDREVTRVGTLIGGLGQMFTSCEELAALGAEAVIAGECLAYTLIYAQELGLAVIEAGHCATENPGMQAMARWLADQLKGIKVAFLDSGTGWTWLDST